MGREPKYDWNATWESIIELLCKRQSRWKKVEQRLFRDVFTEKNPQAVRVRKVGREKVYEPDTTLRDFENIPLKNDIDTYFEKEVAPHVPDAFMDRDKDKVGYEINFNRHFQKHASLRPLKKIDADLKEVEEKIVRLLREVTM